MVFMPEGNCWLQEVVLLKFWGLCWLYFPGFFFIKTNPLDSQLHLDAPHILLKINPASKGLDSFGSSILLPTVDCGRSTRFRAGSDDLHGLHVPNRTSHRNVHDRLPKVRRRSSLLPFHVRLYRLTETAQRRYDTGAGETNCSLIYGLYLSGARQRLGGSGGQLLPPANHRHVVGWIALISERKC